MMVNCVCDNLPALVKGVPGIIFMRKKVKEAIKKSVRII
jgi:hypothetical protein